MPGFDGTGSRGKGPLTGRGDGFCVLQESEDDPRRMVGLAGLQSAPIEFNRDTSDKTKKEVVEMPRGDGTGPDGQGPIGSRGRGQGGRGRMGGPYAAGPGGSCVCPSCGAKAPHTAGQPCNKMSCPQCGARMTRG